MTLAQFDVYKNRQPTKDRIPYLLDLQADTVYGIETRIVVPLVPLHLGPKPTKVLTPTAIVMGQEFMVLVAELAGVPRRYLGEKVANLQELRQEFSAATDLLFIGY